MNLRFVYPAVAGLFFSLVPVSGAMAESSGKVYISMDGPKGAVQCLELSGVQAEQIIQARGIRGPLKRSLPPLTMDGEQSTASVSALDYSIKGNHRGRIDLDVKPKGASLSIDGETYTGKLGDLSLSVGRHILKFEKDGFQTVERSVVATPCRLSLLRVHLTEVQVEPEPKLQQVKPQTETEASDVAVRLDASEQGKSAPVTEATTSEDTEADVIAESQVVALPVKTVSVVADTQDQAGRSAQHLTETPLDYQKAETVARIPGEVFKDCPDCPTIIVVPAGKFVMGQSEKGTSRLHRISKRFAIGQHEVTFDNWDQCVKAGGCHNFTPNDQGWGRENRPVINVSWQDAQDYVAWLSLRTGKSYRLPTEVEWEYAAQAGRQGPFWWGADLGQNLTNTEMSGSRYSQKRTALVGSFRSNPFGLYDVIGNVSEWTADCYATSKSSKNSQHCRRTVRGGSWNKTLGNRGVYIRTSVHEKHRAQNIGFRVLRELEAQE